VSRTVTTRSACAIIALALAACVSVHAMNAYFDPSKPHRTQDGFRNNYPHAGRASFWAWKWEQWRTGVPRIPEGGWHFPLDRPQLAAPGQHDAQPAVTWIGHATILLQLDGLNILTDPMFSQRASPLSFAGPERVVPPALTLGQLPHIDIVLISHNHYDHLDKPSVKALARQTGGPPRFYVPLGLAAWFKDEGITTVTEMDWWDERDEAGLSARLKVHFVPAQHWSARSLWDRNQTLWGGFVVEHPRFRFLFTGDTGYSRDFADIGRRFGSFDLAAIPIGAYEPRWFMATQHVDPDEAVRIHQDVHARQSMAMHWGTFVMTDEPLDEPPQKLAQALIASRISADAFWVLRHGETRRVPFAMP